MPSRNAIAMARPIPVNRTGFCTTERFEAEPASVMAGPVVALRVCAWVRDSFQIAVRRSIVNSAPGADAISCGTVSEKVTLRIELNSSGVIVICDPGEGDAGGCAWVLNV